MVTLESWRYGDPLQALMREEAASCKGCIHEVIEKCFSEKLMTCKLKKTHGKRCKKYFEMETR